jgi:hypothetical protein
MPENKQPMDPYRTICVLYVKGKEVGRIPATAKNATAYIDEMTRLHVTPGTSMEVKYEEDPTGGLLASLHGGHRILG